MGKGFEKPTIDKFESLGLDGQSTGPQLASANILKDKQNGQGELASIKKAGEKEIMTPEQFKAKARELKRCKRDILYFCKKYFKIVSLRDGLVTLNPYPKQQELLKFIQENNRVIVTASRQVGKTTIYTVFLLWYAMYHPDKRIMVCGNKLDIAIEIMDRIRLAYEYCPSSIKIGVTTYNKKCIEFENNSIIRCFATGSSGCRGFSANVLVMDEAAFLPKGIADEFMASVFPVLSSSKDSKAIMVSTPNGTANNLFYDTWQQATDPNVESEENWRPFRFLWYDVPGRDEEWKRQQIATIGINRWMQEFECEFKSSGDASLVPSDSIEHFRMNLKNYPEPAQLNLSKNPDKEITAYFWKPFDPSRTYAASGDISEGTGNDSSVMDVWDVTDVKHIALCARMSCSKATLVDFGYATYEFLKLYGFPPLIFENNGVGAGFVDIMLDTYMYPRDRMFYEQAISPTGKYGEITYGVKSKNKTKLEACMFLNELITTEEIDIEVPDELLVNEMGTFVRKNTSNSITFAAKDKCHDDYMLTWVWGMYLLFADTIQQHYAVTKAFKTKMDRILPEQVAYTSPFDKSLIEETLNLPANKSIVSQLGNLEEHRVVKLDGSERDIPQDELFYGNRQWGHGMNRQFFSVNQTFDFMNGTDWEDPEEEYNILTEF